MKGLNVGVGKGWMKEWERVESRKTVLEKMENSKRK